MSSVTPGLVCAHHHLYSALARGMPPPPETPTTFQGILEQVWWRLDSALDLEMLEWSAKLAAVEALETGTTTIIDHNETPNAIEGSLSVISEACAEVGVRVIVAYGVTDRHGPDGARRGLAENERFLRSGGKGLVGLHASFTCTDDTLERAAGLAADLGVGVHVHVCEGPEDIEAPVRLGHLTGPDWLLAHCVHLATDHHLAGHDPAQPGLQPQQRRRVCRAPAVLEPGGAGHRWHWRRHARRFPAGPLPPSLGGCDVYPGIGLELAGYGMGSGARSPQRSGHLVLRAHGALAPGFYHCRAPG